MKKEQSTRIIQYLDKKNKKREAQRFGAKMIRKMLLAMLLCVHVVAAFHTAAVGSLLGAAPLRVAGQVFPTKCV